MSSCFAEENGAEALPPPRPAATGSKRSFTATRKEAGLFCGSFLRKGEVFACVGRFQNQGPTGLLEAMDLKDRNRKPKLSTLKPKPSTESGPLTVHLGMSTYHAISGRGISQLGNPDG